MVACSECLRPYPERDLLIFGDRGICVDCKPAFFQRIREGGAAIGDLNYAGFWIRFLAQFIDGLILGSVMLVLSILYFVTLGAASWQEIKGITESNSGPGPEMMLAIVSGVILLILGFLAINITYHTFFVGKKGGTPGKLALNLRVVRSDGSPVSYGRAFGRFMGYVVNGFLGNIAGALVGLVPFAGAILTIPATYFPYIMAAFDDEKRALHDRLCDTRVIRV
jgi:uncharacterized RDD family membrane protein YckC